MPVIKVDAWEVEKLRRMAAAGTIEEMRDALTYNAMLPADEVASYDLPNLYAACLGSLKHTAAEIVRRADAAVIEGMDGHERDGSYCRRLPVHERDGQVCR